jgi:signal transduction histidine kinase/FixJ family two-component response regulator
MEKKLLLVDDEEGIRKVLGISLMDMGYAVLTAENGREALAVFRAEKPAIVLTDIKMPEMDGIQLLRAIKSENPDTEVIMITGHGDMELAIKSIKFEATDFVTKPIHNDILEIALNRANERIFMREQLRRYTENLEKMVQEKSARLVQLERLAAIDQAVEGLTLARQQIADDFGRHLGNFNEMPCFVSIHNRDLAIVAANNLFRTRLKTAIGDRSWSIYTGTDATPESCPVGLTFSSGIGQRINRQIQLADGTITPVIVHTAPIRNHTGAIDLVIEISADISEIKRLQDELNATQRKYQQLFDESPCYITVQDRHFQMVAANRRFKDDFGSDTIQCFRIYRQRTEPCPSCPVAKTFADGQPHQGEMVVTSRTGEQIHLLVGTAPLFNADGHITQVMELSTNITQIRKLQENLSALGLMMSSMSHAVKGMLTALDGGIYRMQSGLKNQDMARLEDGLDDVRIMTDRIRNAVLDILYYTKERDIRPEPIEVQTIVDDVIQILEPKLSDRTIQWHCHVESGLGSFRVDRAAMRTALINILENAVEACQEKGETPALSIDFHVRKVNNHIRFEIRDTGIGMDSKTQDKIFTLFFSSKGQRGTGLGLFIAKKVIEQHRGTIHCESEKGRGATFRIDIPVSTDS